MIHTLIGKKIDQTQKFLENGKRIPVTLIAIGDNAVLQVKTKASDSYTAVQIGFDTKKKPSKPQLGHAKKAGFEKVSAIVKEIRLADEDALPTVGESLALDVIFKPGDIVAVSGTSKGKGFAGVVKRHGFRGGPKTHGQSDRERAPGSIGQTTTPGRVYKGKRMAGRMGSDKVTVANLTVVGIDPETKMLLVAGLIPGHKDSIVFITKTGEKKKFVELLEDKIKREDKEAKEAAKAQVEAEKAAKIAEKEAAKEAAAAPKVETAGETVADTTEAVTMPEEVVAPAEEKAEAVAVEEEVSNDATSDVAETKEEEKK